MTLLRMTKLFFFIFTVMFGLSFIGSLLNGYPSVTSIQVSLCSLVTLVFINLAERAQ